MPKRPIHHVLKADGTTFCGADVGKSEPFTLADAHMDTCLGGTVSSVAVLFPSVDICIPCMMRVQETLADDPAVKDATKALHTSVEAALWRMRKGVEA